MIRALSAALLAFACLSVITTAPAHARKNHQVVSYDSDGRTGTIGTVSRQSHRAHHRNERAARRASIPRHDQSRAMADVGTRHGTVIGGRPSGCPRQYCGCGTSLKIFGRIRPELNLASNWVRKFPRTAAAPGMAAARSGHVMVLMEHVGGDRWKVWDANSGGGLTRIHVRSIRGFAVVNPHATNVAQS
jgi:hypothetical protein